MGTGVQPAEADPDELSVLAAFYPFVLVSQTEQDYSQAA